MAEIEYNKTCAKICYIYF